MVAKGVEVQDVEFLGEYYELVQEMPEVVIFGGVHHAHALGFY